METDRSAVLANVNMMRQRKIGETEFTRNLSKRVGKQSFGLKLTYVSNKRINSIEHPPLRSADRPFPSRSPATPFREWFSFFPFSGGNEPNCDTERSRHLPAALARSNLFASNIHIEDLTDVSEFWAKTGDRLLTDLSEAKKLRAPVSLIYHSLEDVNEELRLGRFFFIDILREGILLFEEPGINLRDCDR